MLRECCARTLIIHVCSAHEKVMFLVVILDRAINNNVAVSSGRQMTCYITGTINVHEQNF